MKIKFVVLSCLLLCIILASCQYSSERINLNDAKNAGEEIADPKLTLMLYMAADNDLESYAIQNLKAMEHAKFEKVNVLVLLDRSDGYDETNDNWTDTRLFKVQHDKTDGNFIISKRLSCAPLGLSDQTETELDMANPSVLKSFIEFSKSEYPAEKYALIIWGHGTGWRGRAVAVDDRSQTYMSLSDLGNALQDHGLSVIGFDTCFGGVLENLYELKSCAEYTAACPGVTPGSGWDYDELLSSLDISDFSPLSITKLMAESSTAATSVFVNEKLAELFNSFEDFSNALSDTVTDSVSRSSTLNQLVSSKSYSYSQSPCDIYLDVSALADLYSSAGNSTLAASAQSLRNTINQSVISKTSSTPGIGVHFIPKATSGALASVHSSDYIKDDSRTDQCSFIKESRWWVPTINGNSGSLLDKLFYTVF